MNPMMKAIQAAKKISKDFGVPTTLTQVKGTWVIRYQYRVTVSVPEFIDGFQLIRSDAHGG